MRVSKDRLTRLRKVKCEEYKNPVVQMSKSEVEEKWLAEYVIMPSGVDSSFKVWWRATDPLASVDVRYPYNKHGNALKTSNSAKLTVMDEFLHFVDMNSQPNGQAADSSGPT